MANRCSQLSLPLTVLLLITTTIISVVSGQPGGVTLSLNGVPISNDGYVRVSDIGVDAINGLYCNTDRSDCCRSIDAADSVAQGHWYLPDGSQVGSFSQEDDANARNFFFRNRDIGVVRLNRIGDPTERGRFRCEVANDAGVMVNLYVNIVDMLPTASPPKEPPVSTTSEILPPTGITTPPPPVTVVTVSPITSSGTATAGESYRLECTVTVTGSNDQPTITWLMGPMNNQMMISSGVVTTGGMSTLTFNPLAASDAGTYTCRATLGSAMDSASTTITVQTPTITVRVTSSVATPMVGSMYSLTCTVTGAEGLTDAGAMMTYQWLKNGAAALNQTMATLFFQSLVISDAGNYTCEATVTSSLLMSGPTTTASSNSLSIRLTLPRPTVIMVSTSQDDPLMVHPIGSTVTLTCMADLDPAIDVPVTVNIQFRDPAGSPLTTTTPLVSGSTYSSMATISSFGRDQSGVYTCSATVSPSSSNSFLSGSSLRSETLRVTTGVFFTLGGQSYRNGSSILIGEIGEGDEAALLCVTDLVQCCRGEDTGVGGALGEWFYPNGSLVQVEGSGDDFYRTRGLGIVRLNHRNNAMSPIGQFCCMVPDATFTNKFICININESVPSLMIQVNFHFEVSENSDDISFSLTCNSTGGQASGVIWTRDGFLLDNTNPLVVTDASTLSYSSVLMVSGRTAGTYTCTIRGTSDQDLGSAKFIVQASAPPLDVRATQSSSSAPVEVSWHPPSDAAPVIIGYRIFYGNGHNLLVPSYVTSIVLNSSQIELVSIRSESTQLPSELITATVTTAASSDETPCTCSSEVGIAVGVVILVVGTIAAVTAITVVLCWSVIRWRKSGKSDFAVSANMAYGQVTLGGLEDAGGEYEDPDKLARSVRGGGGGGGNYKPTGCPAPYEFPVSKPEAPVYATADDNTNSGKTAV